MMMRYIIIILCFFPVLLTAQVPDTIFAEAYTDSTFVVAVGTRNATNGKLNIRYIDQVFDSVTVSQYAFDRIRENEDKQRAAELIQLEAAPLTRLYSDVNAILQQYTGAGYLVNAFQAYNTRYIGYYRAEYDGQTTYVRITQDAQAVEVNAQGQPVQNGYIGTWDIITPHRWRLKNFFPVSVVPDGTVFNRMETQVTEFRAVTSSLVLTKVRAIETDPE